MVLAASVECDDIATQAAFLERSLFDAGHLGLAGLKGFAGRHLWLHRSVDALRDVFDGDELVQLQIGRLELVGRRLGGKAVAVVVVLGRGKLVQGVGADVMVGDHEA
jgi:hypothetical protein